MSSFIKYQHLERYENDATEGITNGTCYIFPKLDGSNGSVWYDNGEIKAGSRNRELTLDNDNFNFYKSILENKNIIDFFRDFPNHRLYGEWLVPHTIKNYQFDAWNKFYIFDVIDNRGRYMNYFDYVPILEGYNLNYIPTLYVMENPSKSILYKIVEKNHYLINDINNIGEGIVIKNYNYQNKFGNVIWAKIVRKEFKEKNQNEFNHKPKECETTEYKIIKNFLTDEFILKEFHKLATITEFDSSKILHLFEIIYKTLLEEEIYNIVKQFKTPIINFKELKQLTIKQIKLVLPHLF